MAIPFGMYFLEKTEQPKRPREFLISYDESSDCSMITHEQQSRPFVESALSFSAVIVTKQNTDPTEDDEDDGDKWRLANSWLTTITATRTKPEGPDDDDDDGYFFANAWLSTITATKDRGEGPQDDDDTYFVANSWLMTITVTEVRGEGPQDDEGDERDSAGEW